MALKCPECKSTKLIKYGKRFIARKRVQQYACQKCGRVTVRPKGS